MRNDKEPLQSPPELRRRAEDTLRHQTVDPQTLSHDDTMLGFVREQFAEFALRPDHICFEIAETAAIHNLSRATRFIADLKKIGCRFALDDFGTGLSSFSYLKQLPVDYLKIDGHFVQGILDNPVDHAMVAAINDIGHTMFIQTVAEYVETDAIAERLRTLGVDFMQGHAVGLPVPLDNLTRISHQDV